MRTMPEVVGRDGRGVAQWFACFAQRVSTLYEHMFNAAILAQPSAPHRETVSVPIRAVNPFERVPALRGILV